MSFFSQQRIKNYTNFLGGETTDALGQTVIYDSMEMLKGRRWARLRQRLPEERSRFSIQRIPQKFLLT